MLSGIYVFTFTQVMTVTYKARIGTDDTVTAASTVHASHRFQSNATWPGIAFGHLSALLITRLVAQIVVSHSMKGRRVNGELKSQFKTDFFSKHTLDQQRTDHVVRQL